MIDNVDIDKILIPNKVSIGKKGDKYYTGYIDDNYQIILLCIMLLKLSGYVPTFDESKYMPFLIKTDDLLKK